MTVCDSDSILSTETIPKSLVVLGGGVIGCEYASMFAAFGIKVTLLDQRSQATELVHIGQAVLSYGGTVDFFVQNVFNYPTLAECYRTAALDGINRLGRV